MSYPQLYVGVIVQLSAVIDPTRIGCLTAGARHGPLMPAVQGGLCLDEIARKWRDLANRRLAHFTELYHSGRWTHYYTKEDFTLRMRDVIAAAKIWSDLADRTLANRIPAKQPAARDDRLRPAA